MLFICPKCREKLALRDAAAVCANNHSYDRCKAGYYNLYLSSKSSVHGDNKEMVLARRDFLSRGFYEPLANAIAAAVLDNTDSLPTVLDAGAGEVYWSSR